MRSKRNTAAACRTKSAEVNEACEQLDGDVRDPCALPQPFGWRIDWRAPEVAYGFDTVSEAAHVPEYLCQEPGCDGPSL